MPLTKRQREILTYLGSYTTSNGFAPSFEEIAEEFNYNSLATVHEHLSNLERKGYIKRSYNESRAIEILPHETQPRPSTCRSSAPSPRASRSSRSPRARRCACPRASSASRAATTRSGFGDSR
jgi:SOS-response transcriptional repressor LexA